jgi:methionine-gamma-lyase
MATLMVGFGQEAAQTAKPVVAPLVSTSLFEFDSTEEFLRYHQEGKGYLYLRYGGPNQDAVAAMVAALEGAEAGATAASGMAAISGLLISLLKPGDHILAAHQLYIGTHFFLSRLAPKLGVEVTRVQADDLDAVREALKPSTRVLLWESPTNPGLHVADLAALADIAHSVGALLVVDNSFASPVNQRPLALGTDIVIHSASKYLGGHSALLAGVVVGKRDLVRAFDEQNRILGATLGSFEAWLLDMGMKTLSVRMQRHNENAQRLAEWLKGHPKVEFTRYPGLREDPGHEIATKQMSGFSGMICFGVKGGPEAASRVVDAVQIFRRGVSLGGVESLINQPAIALGFSLEEAERQLLGIAPNMVRLSVGIESADDLLRDLDQALAQA